MPTPPLAPRPGKLLWTCRAGFEGHLFEELAWASAHPRLLGPALVETDPLVRTEPAFGRMAFTVLASTPTAPAPGEAAGRLLSASKGAVHVQGWPVDVPEALTGAAEVDALAEAVSAALPSERRASSAESAREQDGTLGQLCRAGAALWVLGVVPARQALSLAPGGRRRMRRSGDAPSRAAMKLEEALDSLTHEPGRGEQCVDLGAAPGGWTQRLVERGARVIAVDPANLSPELTRHPKVRHVKESAFAFEPEEPVDWLFCDMAWRPLEVAQLLAKWARRGWATHLVANIKLPMKDKNPILWRVRQTLEQGGWRELRMRQLYHDRDEVTVTAVRR